MTWPVDLRGVTESVVTTRGPDDRWNVAALGLHAGDPVTARTWGRTRTRRNFERTDGGYVQFTTDPILFVDAALSIREVDEPLLDAADAWVEVTVRRVGDGEATGTRWVDWALEPVESDVNRVVVPTINRGFNAVVEATVAASRLDVDAFDTRTLEERIDYLAGVARKCGGDREREAINRLETLANE